MQGICVQSVIVMSSVHGVLLQIHLYEFNMLFNKVVFHFILLFHNQAALLLIQSLLGSVVWDIRARANV